MMSRSRAQRVAVTISFCLVAACQTQPTKVRDNPERKFDSSGIGAPIQITPESIVIDARASFDYSISHVPKSVSIQWSDFTEPEQASRGVLQSDLFAIARRLSRVGIGPGTHVVVVGRGFNGDGEEGRIAWTLAYLGVSRVQFAAIDSLKFRFTNVMEELPPKSVPIWKPEPIESLQVPRAELIHVINNLGTEKPVAYRSGVSPIEYRIIDTRSERDYLGRDGFGGKAKIPNMGAINIPWQQFFDPMLRPRVDLAKRLSEVGVRADHRIIVLDEDGVSSAGVVMALRAMGYPNTGLYAGGLQDLMAHYGR